MFLLFKDIPSIPVSGKDTEGSQIHDNDFEHEIETTTKIDETNRMINKQRKNFVGLI